MKENILGRIQHPLLESKAKTLLPNYLFRIDDDAELIFSLRLFDLWYSKLYPKAHAPMLAVKKNDQLTSL